MMAISAKKVREQSGLSQEEFAARYGFKVGTLRHWEQGTRNPDMAASTLLAIVVKFPEIVADVVRAGQPSDGVNWTKPSLDYQITSK